MPNRILRDYTDSLPIDTLSAEAERLFIRLIMKADDFGRFHADPRMVKAACFPLKRTVRETDIPHWIAACEKAGLIVRYTGKGRQYLAIVRFKQRTRQMEGKFPQPDGQPADWLPPDDGQLTVNCQSIDGLDGDGDGDGDGCDADASRPAKKPKKLAQGPHHDTVRRFCNGWRDLYGVAYSFGPKEGAHIKQILAKCGEDAKEARRVIDAYFADSDPWLVGKRHDLSLLVSRVNQYRAKPPTGEARPPEDNGFVRAEVTDDMIRLALKLGPNDPIPTGEGSA